MANEGEVTTDQIIVCGTTEKPDARQRVEMEAGEGTRTLDLRLGKPTLYQLSYARKGPSLATPARRLPALDWCRLASPTDGGFR